MWSLSTNESLQWISLLIYSIQSVRIRRARVSGSMSSSSFCRRTKRFTETLRSPHHQMCPLPLGQQSQTLITLIALPTFPFIFASSSLKAISAHLHNRPSSGFFLLTTNMQQITVGFQVYCFDSPYSAHLSNTTWLDWSWLDWRAQLTPCSCHEFIYYLFIILVRDWV